MKLTTTVTAVVPSYNHARFIRQRIESILAQTYRPLEIIVIDDCSTDDSDAIIRTLQSEHGFTYHRNDTNSGSPFSAWQHIGSQAMGDYLWLCESDDFAEPEFLQTAVSALEADNTAVLFYCNSWVVDDSGNRVGHTSTYFQDYWKDPRWDANFSASGPEELAHFQVRGQTVPNMSSALIKASAFRVACTPLLRRFRLTGDWLFIGRVMQQGAVVFSPQALNNFRQHDGTARVRVHSARSQAEFILTIYLLWRQAQLPVKAFVPLITPAAARFIGISSERLSVIKTLFAISLKHTLGCALLLALSIPLNLRYLFSLISQNRHTRA